MELYLERRMNKFGYAVMVVTAKMGLSCLWLLTFQRSQQWCPYLSKVLCNAIVVVVYKL